MNDSILAQVKQDRIDGALEVIVNYGGIDGSHHKAWVLDQAVRYLTGCPEETITVVDPNGNSYQYQGLGESEEYTSLVAEACDGEDGPDTYTWDVGIAP